MGVSATFLRQIIVIDTYLLILFCCHYNTATCTNFALFQARSRLSCQLRRSTGAKQPITIETGKEFQNELQISVHLGLGYF